MVNGVIRLAVRAHGADHHDFRMRHPLGDVLFDVGVVELVVHAGGQSIADKETFCNFFYVIYENDNNFPKCRQQLLLTCPLSYFLLFAVCYAFISLFFKREKCPELGAQFPNMGQRRFLKKHVFAIESSGLSDLIHIQKWMRNLTVHLKSFLLCFTKKKSWIYQRFRAISL